MKKLFFSYFLSVLFIVSYAQDVQNKDSLNGGFSIKKSIYLEQMDKLNQTPAGSNSADYYFRRKNTLIVPKEKIREWTNGAQIKIRQEKIQQEKYFYKNPF
jgi:hypothetical protein